MRYLFMFIRLLITIIVIGAAIDSTNTHFETIVVAGITLVYLNIVVVRIWVLGDISGHNLTAARFFSIIGKGLSHLVDHTDHDQPYISQGDSIQIKQKEAEQKRRFRADIIEVGIYIVLQLYLAVVILDAGPFWPANQPGNG